MIDSDIIDNLETDERNVVINALRTLGFSGILETMEERLLTRLANGAESESDEVLTERVRAFRRDNARLLSFKQLCESFKGDT